jgi:DNA-binding NarL/FixJ family response regulator
MLMAAQITVAVRAGGFLREALDRVLAGEPSIRMVEQDAAVVILPTRPGWPESLDLRGEGRAPSVVLLTCGRADEITLAAGLGIQSFVGPEDPAHEIVEAVRRAADGRGFCSSSLHCALLQTIRDAGGGPSRRTVEPRIRLLTGREREVAELAAQLLSNDEIAGRLCVSIPTVKTHLCSVFRKLGVRSRVQLYRSLAR